MDVGLIITLIGIGIIAGLLSGTLGIGGAVVSYPMLLFFPPLLGVGNFSPHLVAGIVALQVVFSTLSGIIAQRKHKVVHPKLATVMGITMLIASFAGGYGARYMSGGGVNIVYAVLATFAAILMFVPRRGNVENLPMEDIQFNKPIAFIAALLVGGAGGIAGLGGAFLLVPIMLQVLKIPTRVAIGSSLMITFLAALGSTSGKLLAGHLPLLASLFVVLGSISAAPIGVRLSRMMNVTMLRGVLSLLIVAATIKVWLQVLHL